MKKLFALCLLTLLTLLALPAVACTKAPQPVGSAGNQDNPPTTYVWKIDVSGATWQVTSGIVGDLAHSTTTTIDFGSTSGLVFTGSWATTGHLKNLSFVAHAGNTETIWINGNPVIDVAGGGIAGSQTSWTGTTGGVTGIKGLGLGQSLVAFYGVSAGFEVTHSYLSFGLCNGFASFDQGDAVGLSVMPDAEKPEQLWWMR